MKLMRHRPSSRGVTRHGFDKKAFCGQTTSGNPPIGDNLADYPKHVWMSNILLLKSVPMNHPQISNEFLCPYCSSVPEGKLMGVELIRVYKSGSINWG